MATIQQLETALRNADRAGDVEAARVLAAEIIRTRSAAPVAGEAPQTRAGIGTDPIRARNDEQLRRIRERRGVAERTESEAEAFAKESPFLSSLADLAQSMFGGPTAAPVIQRREAVERQQGLQKVAEARQAEEARLGRGIAPLTVREKAVEAARAIPRVAIESTAQSAGLLGAFGKEGEQIAKGFEGLGSRVVENLGLQEAEGVQFDPYASEAVKVGGAFGSVVPYLVTGGTRALAGAGSAIARGAGAAQVAMATGQGATEARQRIDEFEQETGQQVDPSTRQWVQLGGGAIGLSELLPIPGLIARLPANVRQTATARLTDIATKAGLGRLAPEAAKRAIRETVDELESFAVGRVGMRALEEGTQEGGVNLAQNVLAKLAYNPEQEITEGVAESAALGAIVGGGIRAGTEGVQRLMPGREGAPQAPGVQPPPPVSTGEAIRTVEVAIPDPQDLSRTITRRIEVLSEPDQEGFIQVREDGRVIEVLQSDLDNIEAASVAFQPQPAPIPTEPPVSPPVSAPPPEAPPATSPPGVSPIAEPVVPVEPETPTPPEAPTATPVEPVLPEPLPEPEPEPIAPPSAPQIRDEQTRDYWRSNLDRQREQVQAQVETLSQQPDAEPAQIETLNQRLAEIEEDYRGLERGEAPVPRARPLDDTTASIVAEPNAALADAIRDLPAVGVMDWFAKNGTTDFHRELATRVGGLMKAMERAGFEFNWGVYDQNYRPKDGAERDNYNYVMKKPRVKGAAWTHSKEGAALTGKAGKRVAPDYAFDRVDIGVKGPGLLNSGANEVTILHEFAHAVTVAAIDQLRSKKISPNSRVGQAVKELQSLKRSAVRHKNKLLKDIANGKQVDSRLAQALRNLEGTNAWNNEKELIVQGLTNIDMQIVLKSMPYKKTNGFVEFIREIGRLIGVTEKDMNGLRRLFELTDELIPTDTAAQQEVIQAMMKPGEYGAAVTPAPIEAVETAPAATEGEAPYPGNTETKSRVGDVLFDQEKGIGQVPMNQNVDYFGFTAMMRPSKFLELAANLRGEEKQPSIDYIEGQIREGKPVGSPFLKVDFDTGRVTGHEGRHRMMAIQRVNGDAPVPVHMFGKGEQRARNLNSDKIARFREVLKSEDGDVSTSNFDEAFLSGNVVAPATEPTAPTAAAIGEEPALSPEPTVETVEPTASQAADGGPPLESPQAREARVRRFMSAIQGNRYYNNWASKYSGAREADRALARSYGYELPEGESTYGAFELYEAGKSGALRKLKANYIDQINEAAAKAAQKGITPEDWNDFLQARGARDRNAKIAERTKDENGVSEIPDGGSGMTDLEAEAILTNLRLSGKIRDLQGIARAHDRLRDFMQDYMVESGLVSREQMDKWKREEPDYTPYKGWAADGDMTVEGQEDVHEDYGKPEFTRKLGVAGKPVRKAGGRTTVAANSLYNMVADAQLMIEMGEKNKVVRQLRQQYDENPEAFADLLTVYDENNPKIVKGKPVRITDAKAYKNAIPGYDSGKRFYIEVAPNEQGQAVLRAFQNMDAPQYQAWFKKFMQVSSFLRGLNTRFNPTFWPREFIRSIEDAATTVYVEKGRKDSAAYGKAAAMKTFLNSWRPSTWQGVQSYIMKSEPRTEEARRMKELTEEMVANGGEAGYEFAERAAAVAERMQKALADLQSQGAAAKALETKAGFNKLLKAVGGINEFVDLLPRVAAYRALTEAGLDAKDAARIALRSTLDHTKRGRYGGVIDSLFWFTTPSITNLTKKVRALDSTTGRRMIMAQMAAGFAITLLNMANAPDSDDDGEDDYSQLPEWKKLAFAHIYYSKDADPLVIPVGFLFSFERYLGGKMAEVISGMMSPDRAAVDVTKAAGDVGSALVSQLPQLTGGVTKLEARSVVPSIAAPIYDLQVNRNFFGSPIFNKPYDESMAEASVYKPTTPEAYQVAARWAQEATGGFGTAKGGIDFSPDQLKYFVDQYAGGTGRFLGDLTTADIEGLKKTNPFYFDPKIIENAPLQRFYSRTPVIKGYISAEHNENYDQMEFYENKYPVETDPSVIDAYRDAAAELRELGEAREEMEPEDYSAERSEIMARFNAVYNDVAKYSAPQR